MTKSVNVNDPRLHQWIQTLATLGVVLVLSYNVGAKSAQIDQLAGATKDLATSVGALSDAHVSSKIELTELRSELKGNTARISNLEAWVKPSATR